MNEAGPRRKTIHLELRGTTRRLTPDAGRELAG
jgi:hypothetical protein